MVGRITWVIVFPLLLATLSAIGCHLYAGASIGAYLGATVLVGMLLPPLVVVEKGWRERLAVWGGVCLPFLVHWLTIRGEMGARWSELLVCALVLAGWGLALAGICGALGRYIPAALASTMTVVFALAWLTWPIYLSRTWEGNASARVVARWSVFNPAMQIDGVLAQRIGSWTNQSVAYQLTDLNQTFSYGSPGQTWLCILVCSALGALLFLPAGARKEPHADDQRNRPQRSPHLGAVPGD